MTQQDHLQVFDLILTVWTPLFIGNGNSYNQKEYIYDGRYEKVSFLDKQKFFSFLVERELVEKYSQFMMSKENNLRKFLIEKCGVSDADLKLLIRYQVSAKDALDQNHSLKEIHAFQRDAYDRAYIPGSSVKGALRTAWLLDAVLDDDNTDHELREGRRVDFPEEDYVNLLHLTSRSDDAINSIFRGIQISDSDPIPDKCMILAGKIDASVDGHTHSLNLCRECIAPGTHIRFRMTLDQSILKGRITKKTLERAIQRYDDYYRQTYDRKFASPSGSFRLPQQPHLILGGGAGFFSKSLAYPYLGEREGLRWTSEEMQLMFKKHKHEQDVAEKGISPHTMKYTRFNSRLYPYGYCGVEIV